MRAPPREVRSRRLSSLPWLTLCAELLLLGACNRPDPAVTGPASPRATTITAASAIPQPLALATSSPSVAVTLAEPEAPLAEPALPRPSARFHAKSGAKSVPGRHGLVVSVEAQATRAGVELLELGGSAADAAVATALALAVTHPNAGNLGGGGFALVAPVAGETLALDFREASPQALTRDAFRRLSRTGNDPLSVGVPGSPAGLLALHERFGRLPLAVVAAPAIRLARRGHFIAPGEARAIKNTAEDLFRSAAGRRLFADERGRPRREGGFVKRPELAETLDRLVSEGRPGFYSGLTARSLLTTLGSEGILTESDLSSYRAEWRRPRRLLYRGLLVETMPSPSAGSIALAESLLLLEHFDLRRWGHGSTTSLHYLLEAMRRGQRDRRREIAGPESLSARQALELENTLLDPERWQSRAPILPERATASTELDPLATEPTSEPEHTTHLAVVDADGMAISLTTTLSSSFGARLVTETGIVLNDAIGSFSLVGRNQPVGGRRTTSSMSPTLLRDQAGLALVLGTPGGDTIPSTLLQLIVALVDDQLPLDLAVDAPRVHQSYAGELARFEGARPIPWSQKLALEKLGHRFSKQRGAIGHANSIALLTGVPYGYADPREGGLALAARPKKPSPSPKSSPEPAKSPPPP